MTRTQKTSLNTLAVLIGLALIPALAAPASAAGCQIAARCGVMAFSTVFKALESRPDYGVFLGVRYDAQQRAWNFRYTKDDGLPTLVRIDAVTGQEIRAYTRNETR